GAADPGGPGSLGARDAPVWVELGRVLAEVPDVAVRILAVPVGCALPQPAAEVEPIAHDRAGHAGDGADVVRDRDDVARAQAVLLADIEVPDTRLQREPRVRDPGAEGGRGWDRAAGAGVAASRRGEGRHGRQRTDRARCDGD